MFDSPKKIAHLGFGTVLIGFLIYLLVPGAYWISLGFWLISVVFGIIALVKNGRVFPSTGQIVHGSGGKHLDLFGYIEVYLAILPGVVTIAIIISYIILKRGM